MTAETWVLLFAAFLGGGTIASTVVSVAQRRKVGADATAVMTAAARELVDPLRKELATERAEHAEENKVERQKVAQIRVELDTALKEAQYLRGELAMARVEADELRREREKHRAKIREQERTIRELQEGHRR